MKHQILFLSFIKFIPLFLILSISQIIEAKEQIMITASTGSLGQGICQQLATVGYDLIITGRSIEKLNILKQKLLATNNRINIQTVIIDFASLQSIQDARNKLKEQQLNGIVLIGPRPMFVKNVIPTSNEWIKNFNETFIAPVEVINSLQSNLLKNASIVVISGISSKFYSPNYANYNVIRLAWSGEIKNLATFFAKKKIRVNAISPGIVLTPHHKDRIQNEAIKNNMSFEQQLALETTNIPLSSFCTIDDVAYLTAFLLSNQSKHINSTNISLDGGESTAY